MNRLRQELSSTGEGQGDNAFTVAEYELKISELSKELDQAVTSLRQAISSGKSLQEKYLNEKEVKEHLEVRVTKLQAENDELRASKEIISSTILDSLHKEKEKTLSLEKILQTRVASRTEVEMMEEIALPASVESSFETVPIPSNDSGLQSPKMNMLEELRNLRKELRKTDDSSLDIYAPASLDQSRAQDQTSAFKQDGQTEST